MRKILLPIILACGAVITASAELPQYQQRLMQQRAELMQRAERMTNKAAVVRRVKKNAAAETTSAYENIKFTYASISYVGKYETEDLFGDPVMLGTYYLTLSTSKPDYMGFLIDEGLQVDIMIYSSLPETDEVTVPAGTYLPAPLFEESEGTFDTLFPEMTVNTKAEGSDELTSEQFTFLEEGSIEISESAQAGEYVITLHDMVASNDDTFDEVAVTGSYSGSVRLFNDDPARCDILPQDNYVMEIPNMRSTTLTEGIKIDFYGTPIKENPDRPTYAGFPCGAGDFFSTILSLSASPYADPDAFATTYICGGSTPSTYAGGLWNYSEASGLGAPYGTYLAVYDDDVRAAYAFATKGTIKVEKTGVEDVFNFIIDVEAENGAKMTGSWRGKLDGTPVLDDSGIEDVTADQADAPVEYFNLHGVRIEQPSTGVYIMRKGGVVTKIVK